MNDLDHKDWYQFIFELRSEDIQITEKIFAVHNVISITYNDASNNPIYEPLPGEVLYWEQSNVTGLFPLETDLKSLKDALITQLNVKELPNNKIIKIFIKIDSVTLCRSKNDIFCEILVHFGEKTVKFGAF